MKLERSTYVKIALIVLLCLGVCGFFGGCRGIVPWGGSLLGLERHGRDRRICGRCGRRDGRICG